MVKPCVDEMSINHSIHLFMINVLLPNCFNHTSVSKTRIEGQQKLPIKYRNDNYEIKHTTAAYQCCVFAISCVSDLEVEQIFSGRKTNKTNL